MIRWLFLALFFPEVYSFMFEFEKTTIDLLRHGKPEGGDIFRGATDVPLNEEGWQQMRSALAEQTGWQQIISSPMLRCLEFAEEVGQKSSSTVTVNSAFREISFGDWDGQAIADVHQHSAELIKQYWRDPFSVTPPNAESMTVFQQRVAEGLQQLIKDYRGQHLLLVTHGGVIRMMLNEVLQAQQLSMLRYDVPYASFSRIAIYHDDQGDWPQLVFFNR